MQPNLQFLYQETLKLWVEKKKKNSEPPKVGRCLECLLYLYL